MSNTERKPRGKVTLLGSADPLRNEKFRAEIDRVVERTPYVQRITRAILAILDFLDGKNPQGKKHTKRWLAGELRVSEQAVGQMLNSGRTMEVETLDKIGRIIGIDLFAVMADSPVLNQNLGAYRSEVAGRQSLAGLIAYQNALISNKALAQGAVSLAQASLAGIHETTVNQHYYEQESEDTIA